MPFWLDAGRIHCCGKRTGAVRVSICEVYSLMGCTLRHFGATLGQDLQTRSRDSAPPSPQPTRQQTGSEFHDRHLAFASLCCYTTSSFTSNDERLKIDRSLEWFIVWVKQSSELLARSRQA